MDILMVAAELAPATGDSELSLAMHSLSKAVRLLGHEVVLALPYYRHFKDCDLLIARRLTPLTLSDGTELPVHDAQLASGVQLVLFEAPELYDRAGIYGEDGSDYDDNAARFGTLCRAAAALAQERAEQGQPFDVVHAHDWPAALLPAVLHTTGPAVPSVLSIHDARGQGEFLVRDLPALGVPRDLNTPDGVRAGNRVNALKGGLSFADVVAVPSFHYADELEKKEASRGLAKTFAELRERIEVVPPGIDYAVFNPATDSTLTARYDAEDWSNKGTCKTAVVRELGLELDPAVPLVVALGPFDEDAGGDWLAGAASALAKLRANIAIGGRADSALQKKLRAVARRHSTSFVLAPDADRELRHRLLAGADIVLVPRREASASTDHLRAQRYGAVPVAHAVGTLADGIVDCDAGLETGTGFLFEQAGKTGLVEATERALAAYQKPEWARLVRRVMRADVGWDRPARRAVQLYRKAARAQRMSA